MSNLFKNIDSLEKPFTGGRGSPEIQKYVNSLLDRYKLYTGSLIPPIEPEILAELQNAKIIYRPGSEHWNSSLMPMGSGFIIFVKESLHKNRLRSAICHEVAHTFFFDTGSKPPKRQENFCQNIDEEFLCFWAAREMLVPASLLENELTKLGRDFFYTFKNLSKLAEIFTVSPDIIAWRLTHDLSLLGDDWIVLWWYIDSITGKKLRPKSLYPKHISVSLSNYIKSKIIKNIRRCLLEKGFTENEHIKTPIKLKIKTEEVVARQNLRAISWVSPISRLNK